MNNYLKIREQFCPNKFCEFFEKKFKGNVQIHSQKERRFKCSFCKKTWVEHKHELIFGLKSSKEKFESAKKFFDLGLSIRQIARRIKVSPGTVQRWKSKFEQAQKFQYNDFHVPTS
ncbi:hypothetical protein A2335_00955 [Candidatus Peregrinibacteria bacterium RIFOXYB2_FULL_32_7]|nr:MAG: hypothetical protein A2335_00955 [Candidatus Peregrinibacteria bacterium RIFOXYB2_FULL_32_7]